MLDSRDWYQRANNAPSKTSISTAYMDAAGVGKIITISQALFEGMTARTSEECAKSGHGPWPGGCTCTKDEECISGKHSHSNARDPLRCLSLMHVAYNTGA